MLALLTGGALSVLLGAGATLSSGLGEAPASGLAMVRLDAPAWRAEVTYDSSDKVEGERRAGWIGRAVIEAAPGAHGLLGLQYQHRVGIGWAKDRVSMLAGIRGSDWRVWLQSALTDRDRVSSLLVRITLRTGRLLWEPQAGIVLFDQGRSAPYRRVGSLASLRLWYSLGR